MSGDSRFIGTYILSSSTGTIFVQSTTPTAINTGDIWINNGTTPVTINIWNGSAWVSYSTTNITIEGFTDTLEHFIIMAG